MFPSLPTDNLYKFIFVGCIFLIGLIMYDRIKKEEILSETYNNLINDATKIESKHNILKIDLNRLESDIGYLEKQKNKSPKHTIDSLKTRLDDYSKISETFRESTKILKDNLEIVVTKMEKFEFNNFFWNGVIVILIAGSILSGYAWYHKVQKLQDSILSDEAILKKNQVKLENKT